MKRFQMLIAILCLYFFVFDMASAEDKPEWLKGGLCITMPGSYKLATDEDLIFQPYLCLYDLDDDLLTTSPLPGSALLTQDLQEKGLPFLIMRAEDTALYEDGFSRYKWREFDIVRLNRNDSSIELQYGNPDPWLFGYGSREGFLAPLQILAINSSAPHCWYLEYGVSDSNELEICLSRRSDEATEIYYHFPIDMNFGNWDFTISKGGRIAWIGSEGLYVVREKNKADVFDIGMHACTPVWIDDRHLLYFQNWKLSDHRTPLVEFDTISGEKHFLKDTKGKIIRSPYAPIKASLDPSGKFLATLSMPFSGGCYISVVSLESGETYSRELCPYTQTDTLGNTLFKYDISDDGIYLYSPRDIMIPDIAWIL